ncbi:MAG: ribbon-helix-helix domain-containing protein [Rhizobiales bacterium]|nr:ribbon-helix-helix domain-containing protein [Hyphomicrobiales bacterium]
MKKRSVTIAGHRTSVSVEEPFWQALQEIAGRDGISVASLIAAIDQRRAPEDNLSSAIRVEVLRRVRDER